MLRHVDTPADRNEIYKSMLDTLAKIHSVNIDHVKLSDYGVRYTAPLTATAAATVVSTASTSSKISLPYVLRQIKTWSKAYRATETEPIPAMDNLIDQLSDSLPSYAELQSCLVHGDYRLDNVLLSNNNNNIAAVLDWELSTLGDPLSDVAYWSLPYILGN